MVQGTLGMFFSSQSGRGEELHGTQVLLTVPATLWTGLCRTFVFNNCTTARVFERGNRF